MYTFCSDFDKRQRDSFRERNHVLQGKNSNNNNDSQNLKGTVRSSNIWAKLLANGSLMIVL